MGCKVAFITGINGQDGSYLSELLLEKGYWVFGIIRRMSHVNTTRIDKLRELERFQLFYGDLTDAQGLSWVLEKLIRKVGVEEIEVLEVYNLGAQSHVQVSYEMPAYTLQTDMVGTLNLLEAVRMCSLGIEKVRFYQAGTSEMYGRRDLVGEAMNERTAFNPVSPYAIAKLGSHYLVRMYREGYGLFACNGILFNHESPRRGETFVTKKVVEGCKRIREGQLEKIVLGNLDSVRDWGHARDYVRGMWMMLQGEVADDYVLGTGQTYTVREFVERCFKRIGVEIEWEDGECGERSLGREKGSGVVRVEVHKRYLRPVEVGYLKADYSKAREKLGWQPEVGLEGLIEDMFLG
jgi:GDPmannose 4,6-dehydratase